MNCRHCKTFLKNIFLDLGYSPPSNAYLTKDNLHQSEVHYPLKVLVCDQCWLVQTEDYINAQELFTSQYAYFSSTSSSWLGHAKNYTDKIIKEFPHMFTIIRDQLVHITDKKIIRLIFYKEITDIFNIDYTIYHIFYLF